MRLLHFPNSPVLPTGVTLDKNTLTIAESESAELVAIVVPENATDKTVSWHSDDESIVTVNDGHVVAVGVGETVVTVTTSNGKTATCAVTVTATK